MIHRFLVTVAIVCSLLLAGSFVLFARDQLAGASTHQVNEIAATTQSGAPVKPHQVAQPRRFIDGAARTLSSPFRMIIHSGSQWTLHAVPTLFGLLLYGVGLGYLARFSRGMS